MLIVLIFAVIFLYAGLGQYMGKGGLIRGSHRREIPRPGPVPSATPSTGTGTAIAPPVWTALDDIQLNRLLKESS